MKKFTTLLLVLALTLSTILSVVPMGIFADSATEITDNSGYSGGIRKKSDGSILFSPFITPLRELVTGGASLSNYTIDMTFTLLTGKDGTEVHTFETVSAAINASNGQYFDIYLNGKLGNSGFCPTAEAYYNVYVEIYTGRTETEKGAKVMYGTYTSMQAASAISGSSYYAPTQVPVSAPQITETTDGYTGNISYKGEGIRKRGSGQISFCPYITELRTLVTAGAKPSDFTAELTFNLLSGKDGEIVRTFDPVTVTPENGTVYFYLTLADGNGNCGFIPTAGEYYDIEVKIYDASTTLVTYGTYKSTPAQAAIADSEYYDPTPLTVQITETTDEYTGTKLYKNGIRKNSGGSIMVSAFITELRAAINAGKSYDQYTIKTVFTLLDGEGKEVATFPEVTLKPKASNGQYFDIPLKDSGFIPTAGSYYNIKMDIYEDGVLKFYGTYKNIVALDAIAESSEYIPTPVPGAPTDYEISLSYSFNNALKGSAAGTIFFSVDKPGYFALTWGDKDGNPLTVTAGTKTLTYSELVKFNITNANGGSYAQKVLGFTAIPQGAETLIVVDSSDNVIKSITIPADKLQPTDAYTFSFGAISDLHYEYFYTDGVDDAIYAVDTALAFYEAAGSKLVVATGDYSKYTEEAAYQKYQTAVGKVNIPVIACGGNHEVYGITADKMFAPNGYWRTYMNNGVYDGTMEGVLNVAENGIDFAYSYPGIDNYVFLSLSQWKWDGHSATQDCLVTDSQLAWLEDMLETYKDKTVYLLFHTYLGDDDYESFDGEGDMINPGGYTYGGHYNKYTKDEKIFRNLLDKYENVVWFNGHSHYEYSIQKYNDNLNIFDYMGTTATMIHVPSVTNLRTVTDSSTNYSGLHGKASQGALMFVYDDYQIMNGVDLWEEEILSYACFIVYDDKTGIVEDGTIEGTDITWTWDAQLNSIRILGTGEMPDFTTENPAPWAAYANDVMTVYVGKGITNVGANAFAGAAKLQTVELKDDIATIGENAFANTAISKLILPEGLKTVEKSAFAGITAIEDITYSGSKASYAKIDIAEGNDALGGTVNYRKFNITWDVNGEITNEEFKVGEVPVFDGVPTKNHTNPNKHYIFTGWSDGTTTYTGALPKVAGEVTYTAVFGSEVDRYVTGTLSDGNIIWTVDRTLGVLIISGTGAMPNWTANDRRPWASYNSDIYKAIVKSGVTTVGSFSFSKMEALQTVVLEEGVTTLNADAMSYNDLLTNVYLPSTLTFIGQGTVYQSNNLKNVYAGFATAADLQDLWDNYGYNTSYGSAEFFTTLIEFAGHQTGDNSIRFVGKVNDAAINAYDKVDLLINVAGKTFTYPTSKVYSTLRGTVGESVVNVVTTTKSGKTALIVLDTDYLYGYGVTNIPAGEYTFEITPVAYIGEAKVYGETVKLTVTVEDSVAEDTEPAPYCSANDSVAQLAPSATYNLAENATFNTAVKKVTYTSSNTAVATVDANGVITAVADGTAIITLTAINETKSYSDTITVIVKTPWTPTEPNDIELYNVMNSVGKLNSFKWYGSAVEVWSNTLQILFCIDKNELDASKIAEHSFDIYLKEAGSDEMGGYDKATIQAWSFYTAAPWIYRCKFYDALGSKLTAGTTYEMVVVVRKGTTALAYANTSLTWTAAMQAVVDGAVADTNVIK